MTLSIFDALKGFINAPLIDIIAKLESINIITFQPLYRPDEGQEEKFTGEEGAFIILYIIYAYSEQSEMVLLGDDISEQKSGIADRVGLPFYLHEKVVRLKSSIIRKVVVAYLDKQTNRVFKHLQLKKDMYEALANESTLSLFDQEGAIKAKDMAAASSHLDKLMTEINQHEEMLRTEYKYRFDAMEDLTNSVKSTRKGGFDNGSLENSTLID